MAIMLLILAGWAVYYGLHDVEDGTLNQVQWVSVGIGALLLVGSVVIFLVRGDE